MKKKEKKTNVVKIILEVHNYWPTIMNLQIIMNLLHSHGIDTTCHNHF
jgi:hypothetical protein